MKLGFYLRNAFRRISRWLDGFTSHEEVTELDGRIKKYKKVRIHGKLWIMVTDQDVFFYRRRKDQPQVTLFRLNTIGPFEVFHAGDNYFAIVHRKNIKGWILKRHQALEISFLKIMSGVKLRPVMDYVEIQTDQMPDYVHSLEKGESFDVVFPNYTWRI